VWAEGYAVPEDLPHLKASPCRGWDSGLLFITKGLPWEAPRAYIHERFQQGEGFIRAAMSNANQMQEVLQSGGIADARPQTMDALARSEARYRALVENASECVCRWLPDTTLIFVNNGYCRYFGKSREELIGTHWIELMPEADRDAMMTHVNDLSLNPRLNASEHEVIAANGIRRWQEWIDTPILDENGSVIEFQSIGRDITDRKRLEAELQHRVAIQAFMARVSQRFIHLTSEEVDAAITETLGEIGMLTDVDRAYIFLLDEARHTMHNTHEWCAPGVQAQLATGQNIAEESIPWAMHKLHNLEVIYVPRMADMPPEAVNEREFFAARAIQSVLVVPLIWRGVLKGFMGLDSVRHERRWTAEDRQALETLANTFAQVFDRRRADEALRKLSRAVEQSPISVLITDLQGRIEYANPRFTEFTGYSLAEVRGKNPSILKSGETPAEVYANLWATITAGRKWQGELLNRTKDGKPCWEWATILPILDATGAATHYLALLEDITARKLLEDQLRQKHRVEAIGQLAGGVAHDFNNMLQVILGHAEIALLQTDSSTLINSSLQEILHAARRSAELTNQLLAFARRQVVTPQVLNLNDVIEGMLKFLGRLISEDIKLEWRPGPDLWPVKMDPLQVHQILANLAVNARDAMDKGGTLTIETRNMATDDAMTSVHGGVVAYDHVLLSASDNGCGMDKATLDHIFEPFYTTKEKGQGTGLGLSTVYGIVAQNGGFIQVLSEPGKGSRFNIYLPRVNEDVEAVPRSESETAPSLRGTETILYVEDEEAILKIGKPMLEDYGYRVIATNNPLEALALAKKDGRKIDLLITDVVMPGMSGKELSTRLKAERPDLKTLYVSGYTDDIIALRGVLEPGTDLLNKPYSVTGLTAKVREILDRTDAPT
jgi:PAS domain S-box-containing protein